MAKILLFSNVPVFTPDGMASGLGLRVWGMAQALTARGHQVQVLEPYQRGAATRQRGHFQGIGTWGESPRSSGVPGVGVPPGDAVPPAPIAPVRASISAPAIRILCIGTSLTRSRRCRPNRLRGAA